VVGTQEELYFAYKDDPKETKSLDLYAVLVARPQPKRRQKDRYPLSNRLRQAGRSRSNSHRRQSRSPPRNPSRSNSRAASQSVATQKLGPFDPTEQVAFENGVRVFGWSKWTRIAETIPGRSVDQVRNYARRPDVILHHRPSNNMALKTLDKFATSQMEGMKAFRITVEQDNDSTDYDSTDDDASEEDDDVSNDEFTDSIGENSVDDA
jgi:hypothetical protein